MRSSTIARKTAETNIDLSLSLDGNGERDIDIPVGFLSHMLVLFACHSNFDLRIKATGDTIVDYHHTVEDIGIALGETFFDALGDKKGIKRYSSLTLPMDESLVSVAIDIGGRASFVYNAEITHSKVGDFDTELVEEFFRAFAFNAKINLHIKLEYGTNAHHIIEAMFKAVARALRDAITITGDSIPSSKGVL